MTRINCNIIKVVAMAYFSLLFLIVPTIIKVTNDERAYRGIDDSVPENVGNNKERKENII